ncbi:hypothetical protein FEM03_17850 [Phragmitibacter flavus]|uniref:Uncharacterized protein n=1 Tax=Phragmitibacter flavus TaxID=2576071 RepID=A0A5R8KB17_9BACT|nr:hypothetical protein [Phragmitibacter flavus]TLD69500.1 hypothetical protein FEM03_17850 [Phragmitibacter flavus]
MLDLRFFLAVPTISAALSVIQAESPAPSFKVLEQTQIVEPSGRKVTFKRVEPPVSPPRPAPEPAPVINPMQPSKPMHVLLVSCTVYPGPITELRWGSGDTKHHAFSNVDFLDIAGIGHFETTDSIHGVVLGIGTDKASARSANQPALPALTGFTGSHAQYLLLPTDKKQAPNDPDLEAMDALHAFYDANKAALKQQRSEREAANTVRLEQELLRQEEPKPDTIIHFWPIKSQTHPSTSTEVKP